MFDLLPIHKHDFDERAVDLAADCHASHELLSAFAASAIKVSCPDHRVLFQKGEPGTCVYLVQAGEVGLIHPVSSTRALAFRARKDSLVGLPAAFSDEPYSLTAVAWQGAELALMSSAKFCKMVASDRTLSMVVLRILAAETRAARMVISTHMASEPERT